MMVETFKMLIDLECFKQAWTNWVIANQPDFGGGI